MTAAELKLDIFRTIDQLKKGQLDELSGVISNFVHGKNGTDDWNKLSNMETKAILDAKASIRKNGGSTHASVMNNMRKKIANA